MTDNGYKKALQDIYQLLLDADRKVPNYNPDREENHMWVDFANQVEHVLTKVNQS